MGYLTEKIYDAVGRLSQERGRSYFSRGAVKQIEGDAWRAKGKVQGSQLYEIRFSFADDYLNVSCSCPFFVKELSTCKHIWAAALAAERDGLLKGAANRSELEILEIESELQPHYRSQRASAPKAAPVPGWKQELRMLESSMQAGETERNAVAAEKEVLYVIDADSMNESAKLFVEVARRERKMNGARSKLKSPRLYPQEIASFTDPMDRRIVAVLFGARQELGYGYSSYYSDSTPARFMLSTTLWDVLLPLLCATGRCFLRHGGIIDE